MGVGAREKKGGGVEVSSEDLDLKTNKKQLTGYHTAYPSCLSVCLSAPPPPPSMCVCACVRAYVRVRACARACVCVRACVLICDAD